jgi:hypothetical protein
VQRPTAASTPASHNTVFPIPASPASTNAAEPCSTTVRNASIAPRSTSRPPTPAVATLADDSCTSNEPAGSRVSSAATVPARPPSCTRGTRAGTPPPASRLPGMVDDLNLAIAALDSARRRRADPARRLVEKFLTAPVTPTGGVAAPAPGDVRPSTGRVGAVGRAVPASRRMGHAERLARRRHPRTPPPNHRRSSCGGMGVKGARRWGLT